MKSMYYACRSCLLRLGRPSRLRASLRPWPPTISRSISQVAWQTSDDSSPGIVQGQQNGLEAHSREPLDLDLRTNDALRAAHDRTAGGPTRSWSDEDSGEKEEQDGSEDDTFPDTPTKPLVEKVFGINRFADPWSLDESLSTLADDDTRLRFLKDMKELAEGTVEYSQLLHRFGGTEALQRERLKAHIPPQYYSTAIRAFEEWKSVVKDAFAKKLDMNHCPSMTETRLLKWMETNSTLESMLASLPVFERHQRHEFEARDRMLLSAALRHAPEKLDQVLECVLRAQEENNTCYPFVIEDTFQVLTTRLVAMDPGEEKTKYAAHLARQVIRARKIYGRIGGGLHFSQATIFKILDSLEPKRELRWYRQLREHHVYLHPFTQLQFASKIARNLPGSRHVSVRILRKLAGRQLIDINSPVAASVCTSILTFHKNDLAALNDVSATPADLFRFLHDLGMVPNVITYSAIIRGLCLRQDLKTALDIFDIMKQHGVQPDGFTYSIIIHGCRLSGKFDVMAELAVEFSKSGIQDPVVWTEILCGVYVCCIQRKRRVAGLSPLHSSIHALNQVFQRVFDSSTLAPLIAGLSVKFGVELHSRRWIPEELAPLAKIPLLPPQELLKPSSDVLGVMLLSFVRSLAMPHEVVFFYAHFKELLRQQNPVAMQLVRDKGTFVNDIVMRNIIRWRGTLRIALDIVREMLKEGGKGARPGAATPLSEVAASPGPASDVNSIGSTEPSDLPREKAFAAAETGLSNVESSHSTKKKLGSGGDHVPLPAAVNPLPSVHTWSILMYGFMRNELSQEAESIMELMREHGVVPNIVTFNTLAAGYAKMQNIPRAVKAMQRLEAEGLKADAWTMKAFSYITNKRRAIQLMEQTVEENRVKKSIAEAEQASVPDQMDEEDELMVDLAAEWQESGGGFWGDEAEMLAWDAEERLDYLDPGAIPYRVTNKVASSIKNLNKIAPSSGRPDLQLWAKVRDHGLSELSAIRDETPEGRAEPGFRLNSPRPANHGHKTHVLKG